MRTPKRFDLVFQVSSGSREIVERTEGELVLWNSIEDLVAVEDDLWDLFSYAHRYVRLITKAADAPVEIGHAKRMEEVLRGLVSSVDKLVEARRT